MKGEEVLRRDAGAFAGTIVVGLAFPVVVLWVGVLGSGMPPGSVFRDAWLAVMSASIYLPLRVSSGVSGIIMFCLQGFVAGGAIDLLRWYRSRRAH